MGRRWLLRRRASHLSGQAGWSGFVELGVESQPGDEGYGLNHGLTEVEQSQGSVAAVRDHHYATVWKPAAKLEYHLARPVGDLLMGFAYLEVVAFGGSESGQHRERPAPMRPGNVGEPHEAYPSQSTGLDQMGLAGTHSVSVDASGLDSPTPAPLDGLVYAEHKRLIALCEILDHEQ